jgi:transcriptional antiterminator NusG
MSGSKEKRWYFLRAVSGQEQKSKGYLENEIAREGLSEHFGQILVPTQKVFEMKNGKKKLRERVLYSGYILLEVALEPYMIPIIKEVPGIIGFLGNTKGGDPEPIPSQEVKRILGTVDAMNEEGEVLENPFIKGEPIKVSSGPFAGFDGIVDDVNEHKKVLKVVVKIFGRETQMELKYAQVEKVF